MLMGKEFNGRCFFPLTSLQIGDLQSYLSHLNIFLAPESKKVYILVDNRPWLREFVSRPAHLWQLMVTKSRLSPFANTRRRRQKKETEEILDLRVSSRTDASDSEKLKRWFSLIDASALSHKRALLPVKKLRNSLISNSKLHRTLYGFIVFEVAWNDVRGINYLNELQTDTSLAIETKCMTRWEFDSIAQAARCISYWFPGTEDEENLLKEYLDPTAGDVFYDAPENFRETSNREDDDVAGDDIPIEAESPCCGNNSFRVHSTTIHNRTTIPHTPPPDGPYKRRKVMKSINRKVDADMSPEETDVETVTSPTQSQYSYDSDCEDTAEATQYRDIFILFRFSDRDLPFKLKEIIMQDTRLLTLLEAGLPSWVIFFQSYPGFCHLYRPWMCPLARFLYVVISVVTVVIGFYDLYKNVPLLKATASSLFGPFFDWIETWEMVSRIKYLGTMLFLHNFEKAVTWFLMMTRTIRSFLAIITQPVAGPFSEFLNLILPLWKSCGQLLESFSSVIWISIESLSSLLGDLMEIVLLPVWCIVSVCWSIATSVLYPIFWIFREVLCAPFRLVLGLSNLVICLFTCLYELIGDIWIFMSSIFKITSSVEARVSSYEVSIWRSLWNDLFSQIFRAVRSILNGFVAFFAACNRHRLSIYNHVREFRRRFSRPAKRSMSAEIIYEEQNPRSLNMRDDTEAILHRRKYSEIR